MNLSLMQKVMLDIAGNASVESALDRIVSGIAECENVVLCRIWLIRERADDRGIERFLELAASAGHLRTSGVDPKFLKGRHSRFAIGERKIGFVAQTGKGLLIPHAERPESLPFADREWIEREGVRTFAAQPLIARGQTLGVLGVFDRAEIPEVDFGWLRTFADHAAVALTTARAFEEIEALKRKLELENEYLRTEVTEEFGEIRGKSPALEKVLRQIAMVAPTDASVLVLGESGVGKELVARAIHERSARSKHPLIKVNCGSIPTELFESEFFGHVRGAFTGAQRDRAGRFELADGGTLFLDEIGEIPLSQQAKLLRVLQEGTFERVGEERTRRVDVRVIAATNRDLAAESTAGRFRSDLYYRLSVFPIEVPPLRERREDIADLAALFVERAAATLKTEKPRLTKHHVELLMAYGWPGNVRELQHVVERAVILSRGGPLRFDRLSTPQPLARVSSLAGSDEDELPTLADLRDRERSVIELALRKAEGKVSGPGGAAELLGVKPTTLESKLRVLGLKPRTKRPSRRP